MMRQGIFNHDMITLNSGCGKLSNFALQLNVFGVTIQQPLMILHFYSPVFAPPHDDYYPRYFWIVAFSNDLMSVTSTRVQTFSYSNIYSN